ncbi:MAG TPA: hypothetical protein VLJ83_04405 [Gemmatimonadaceae bacterium]|nr:hypothetical protein [Gemmatimonadaceae bacterium]
MNPLRRALLGSVCLLASTSATGLAQKTYALGLGGGATIPVGKLADTQKTGYNGIVAIAIGVADLPLGVRFDGMYNTIRGNGDVVTAPGGGTTTNSGLRVTAALANLVFAFPGTTAKAYIIAGGGLYNSRPDIAGAKAQNNFGFNAGLGSTFGSGPFAIFLEARYHTVSRSVAKGGVYQFVPITLGLLF